jgi:hypothetical protein
MFYCVLGSYYVRSMDVNCLAIDSTRISIGPKYHDAIIRSYPLNDSHLQMGSSKLYSR